VLIYLAGYFLFGAGYIAYMTFMIAYVRDAGGGAAAQSAFWCLIGLSAFVTPWVWRRVLARNRGGTSTAIILGVNAIGAALPQAAMAGTATTTLGVSLTITAGCTVLAPPIGASATARPSNPAVEINCTGAVPYSVTRYSVLDIAPDAKGVTLTVIY